MGQAKARGTFAERQATAIERDKAEAAKLRELGRLRREAEYAQRQRDREVREAVEQAAPAESRHSDSGARRRISVLGAGGSALFVAAIMAASMSGGGRR